MQLEVPCFVADGKVALGHLGLGSVKGHLITGEPPLVADDSGAMDGWTSKVKINITAQVDILTLVGCLDFAALLAVGKQIWFIVLSSSRQSRHGHQRPSKEPVTFPAVHVRREVIDR